MYQIRQQHEYQQTTTKEINQLRDKLADYKEKVNNFQTALKALNTIK